MSGDHGFGLQGHLFVIGMRNDDGTSANIGGFFHVVDHGLDGFFDATDFFNDADFAFGGVDGDDANAQMTSEHTGKDVHSARFN
ncbi:hypothetical protein SDC9_176817 [bioreactor metagenome]|uniref:Uncharacterized protein n=1 Tax=bioreactor metagenome TaxID=1076179 RepID=A0A645GZ85_9ZZZZ